MRNAIINAEFHDFRVDHDELYILRLGLVKKTHDDRVDADRFTGTGRACNQKVRHPGNIGYHRLACDIFSGCKGQTGGMLLKFLRFQKLTQGHRAVGLVRHLDTDSRFSGNRCLNTDIGRRQIQLDVIRKIDNPADLHALIRGQLIPGDRGAAAYVGDTDAHAEVVKRLLQLGCRLPKLLIPSYCRIALGFA